MSRWKLGVVIAILMVTSLLSGCGAQRPITASEALVVNGELARFAPAAVSGPIAITGSSTVYPLTLRMAREFNQAGSPAKITLGMIGSGAGIRAFCSGAAIDIVNASRAMRESEVANCRAIGRNPVGFEIGIDALAVVTAQNNAFLSGLTFQQLEQIFTGQVRTWNELDPNYPSAPIAVFSPGADSGTFDFFVDVVLKGNRDALLNIPGLVTSEDDEELVRGIEANPYAIGYFGFAYYKAEAGKLRALALDRGAGMVPPAQGSAQSGRYPLTRPLFIYSSTDILRTKPQVAAFVSFYLQYVYLQVDDVGYFMTAPTTNAQARATLAATLVEPRASAWLGR